MKRIISIITIFSLLLLFACKKVDVNGNIADQGTGSYLTKVAVGTLNIPTSSLSTAKVDVTVREYGSPVEKIKIFVTPGQASTNNASWKAVKEVPYSGDTKLEVSATEIATALGVPLNSLETGIFTLYNQVISKDGQVHDITNMNSTMYGSPNYNTLMTWEIYIVCPFDPTAWGGVGANVKAVVISDGWGDYSPGDTIKNIDIVTATQLRFNKLYLTDPSDTRPVLVNITATTGAASVSRQIYGDYPANDYFDISVASSGINNWAFSCSKLITLTLDHRAGSKQYGVYVLKLRKV